MSEFQKVIKYIAIAFGIYLALQILMAIIIGVTALIGTITGIHKDVDRENVEIISSVETYDAVQNLKIELAISDLVIQEGEEWKVEVVDMPKEFVQKRSGGTLTLSDENINHNWFQRLDTNPLVKVTIPEGMELDTIKIETGVGNAQLQNLICDTFKLSQGVGNVQIGSITANKINVQGGAGSFTLENVQSQELKLEAGVGKTSVKGKLEGNSKIEAGVGALQLELVGTKEDYTIRPQTGIGAIYIDGSKVEGNTTYGEGNNQIRIQGGMGKIEVSFME